MKQTKSKKSKQFELDPTGTVLGFITYRVCIGLGLYTSIMSFIATASSLIHGEYDMMIIWSCLGLFAFSWFLYFSYQLYQLIKNIKQYKNRLRIVK